MFDRQHRGKRNRRFIVVIGLSTLLILIAVLYQNYARDYADVFLGVVKQVSPKEAKFDNSVCEVKLVAVNSNFGAIPEITRAVWVENAEPIRLYPGNLDMFGIDTKCVTQGFKIERISPSEVLIDYWGYTVVIVDRLSGPRYQIQRSELTPGSYRVTAKVLHIPSETVLEYSWLVFLMEELKIESMPVEVEPAPTLGFRQRGRLDGKWGVSLAVEENSTLLVNVYVRNQGFCVQEVELRVDEEGYRTEEFTYVQGRLFDVNVCEKQEGGLLQVEVSASHKTNPSLFVKGTIWWVRADTGE